jgi:hypothetical protein
MSTHEISAKDCNWAERHFDDIEELQKAADADPDNEELQDLLFEVMFDCL